MNEPIHQLRQEYTLAGLRRADLDADPMQQFSHWFEQARKAEVPEPNAMTLATVDSTGQPSSRIVLLKAVSETGFTFFTNYESRKGRELAKNSHAALTFFWQALERQVCVSGVVAKTSREESEKYFSSRPRGSRLSAWVSHQSEAIPGRAELEKNLAELEARYPENIPLPPHWGGYHLTPHRIEFWQGRRNRLHDRFRYLRTADNKWAIERLAP